MEAKMFEILDRATFIPVVCIKMDGWTEREDCLLSRAGFGKGSNLIQLVWISARKSNYDPFLWNDRTLQVAHRHIAEHWSLLETGDVVDVEFILGETSKAKPSEQFCYPQENGLPEVMTSDEYPLFLSKLDEGE